MALDGHIHIRQTDDPNREIIKVMREANVDGGVLISPKPGHHAVAVEPTTSTERIELLFEWVNADPNLFGFYWIDPLDADAIDQVHEAVSAGVHGFKVICDHFYPGDERAIPIYQEIARNHRPILFHSGILWDGKPSSPFNRPLEFELLLDIAGLKFCLAHVSWPWCDECLAVYGKFLHAHTVKPESCAEMFIDITPGTPAIYRREVLAKLFGVGYDIENNVIFGSDCIADDYSPSWAIEWLERDRAIYAEIGLGQEVVDKIQSGNLKRFLGVS